MISSGEVWWPTWKGAVASPFVLETCPTGSAVILLLWDSQGSLHNRWVDTPLIQHRVTKLKIWCEAV